MASEAISEHQKFPGGACPQTPQVLHAYEVVLQARPEVGLACETTYEVTQAYWHAHI